MASTPRQQSVTFLTATQSAQIDEKLMSDQCGYTLTQLMELAGLSVALAVAKQYPNPANQNITVLCGPGNNGGDGLVAARHLHHFGYSIAVLYPRRPSRSPFPSLIRQLNSHNITILPLTTTTIPSKTTIILDAMFGFSFKPPIRPPYDALINNMNEFQQKNENVKVVAVDVPSGWLIDYIGGGGENEEVSIKAKIPNMVVSLTAPKKCVQGLEKNQNEVIMMCGGRFVPQSLEKEMNIVLPKYHNAELVTRIQ